jgi:Putative beta barrel porin-7 (BBP7)
MSLRLFVCLAALCGVCQATAAEQPTVVTQPYTQSLEPARPAEKPSRASKARPAKVPVKATSAQADRARAALAQSRMVRLAQASKKDEPADTPSDPFEENAAPADEPAAPAEEMETPLEGEPPSRPDDQVFEINPGDEPPATEVPAERSKAKPGRREPTVAPPKAPTRQVPRSEPRTAPPAGRPGQMEKVAPPRTSAPSRTNGPPPAEFAPSAEEPYFDESEPYFEGECGDGCMSCAEAVGSCGYWENFCYPPISMRAPKGSWVTVDYLMWWSRGQSLPALVTTGDRGGALTDPALSVLFGNDRVDNGIRSGGRINVGTWLNMEQTWGLGASFLQMQNVATNYSATSNGFPTLARPFVNSQTGADDSSVVAQSNVLSGGIQARTTGSFVAGDAYFRRALAFKPGRRIDALFGWRYMQLDDSLQINDHSQSLDPTNPQVPLGTVFTGQDQFRTRNIFNGAELGLMSERRRGIWSLNTVAKVSLGNMNQTVLINGTHTTTEPGVAPFTGAGSLLTQPSNIGHYQRNVFAAVPEVTLNLGVQITPRLRGTVGYSLIYISNVVQSGRQANPLIDPTQILGGTGTQPSFQFHDNTFWLQGLNFGLNYQF